MVDGHVANLSLLSKSVENHSFVNRDCLGHCILGPSAEMFYSDAYPKRMCVGILQQVSTEPRSSKESQQPQPLSILTVMVLNTTLSTRLRS